MNKSPQEKKEKREKTVPIVPILPLSYLRFSCMTRWLSICVLAAPVHQMQQYYRLGALDNCSQKWSDLFDCLNLKTKSSSEVQVCMIFLDIDKFSYTLYLYKPDCHKQLVAWCLFCGSLGNHPCQFSD